MKNVLIIKPSALGDVIQATSILPALRESFPGIRLSWLVFEHNAEIVSEHPMIDQVISFNRRESAIRQLPRLTRELRTPCFDAVIDIQCLLRSALFSRLTGCPRRIGYANGREHSSLFYTEAYDVPADSMHAVDRYLRLCELLGAPRPKEVSFPLPLNNIHRKKIAEFIPDSVDDRPLVTLCPTAKWKTKCWPEASYAQLADLLRDTVDAEVVLTGAPYEREAISRIARQMKGKCVDLTGRLSIMELAALLERSDLYVGNDSGLMHLAAAVGAPVVAIFGPTSPLRTGPYGSNHSIVGTHLDCSPCFRRNCESTECMATISVEEVFRAARDRIRKTRGGF